ncbi:MAG: arylsulfatase [Bacteroidota bacterium]|nr:arylsulfatase [Bacteroidota bacterium]
MKNYIRTLLPTGKKLLTDGTICLSLFSSVAVAQKAKTVDKRPNIVIILADDIGFGDFGCYGATKVKTPNVDNLARKGVQFSGACAPASTCTPSRYSLLTGEYAWRKNVGILQGDAPITIKPGSLTMPSMLQKQGYVTGCIGKWHLGLGNGNVDFNKEVRPSPNDVGFNYSFILPATGDRVPCVYLENSRVVGLDPNDPIKVSYTQKVGNDPTGKEHPELLKMKYSKGHDQTIVNGISRIGYMTGGNSARWKDEDLAEVITGKAVDFIKEHADKPFFLYFATHDIHVPRVPSARFRGSSQCGVRGDVIQQFDWSVGEVLNTLKALHLDENTIVIVTSDNGPIIDDGYADGAVENLNGHRAAGMFRGFKYSLYEGGTRVPFIISWPKVIKPGTSDVPFPFIDLFASFAELSQYKLKSHEAIDSHDALSILLGKDHKPYRDYVLIQNNNGELAVKKGDWKLIPVESKTSKMDQLYNLKKDIGETTNLADQEKEEVEALRKIITDIKSTVKN